MIDARRDSSVADPKGQNHQDVWLRASLMFLFGMMVCFPLWLPSQMAFAAMQAATHSQALWLGAALINEHLI